MVQNFTLQTAAVVQWSQNSPGIRNPVIESPTGKYTKKD